MPMVLHGVVGPPGEEACDQRPLVSMNPVSREEPLFLFVREGPLVDPGVELVEPPQSTALSCTEGGG